MAEWAIRAVWTTELERHLFNADSRRQAIMYAHSFLSRQDGQPYRSGKIVLLDATGAIVSTLPNLNDLDNDSDDDEEREEDVDY